MQGWRKSKQWRREIKHIFRTTSKVSRCGGKNKQERLEGVTELYLQWSRKLEKKVSLLHKDLLKINDIASLALSIELEYYLGMLNKHIDLVERRIMQGEKINADEKLYSIFETHTEWISKGKSYKPVELGHNVLIASDQYHFIIHHQVVEKIQDSGLAVNLAEVLNAKFPSKISSLSLDKGFYSKPNKEQISKIISKPIMPKKGKRNQQETSEEHDPEFIKLRYAHSAVESNINQLEHNGLSRCRDRGIKNFKRYVSLSVLAYNIHRLGKYTEEISNQAALKKAA